MEWTGDDRLPPLRHRAGRGSMAAAEDLARIFGSTEALGPADGPPALVIPGFVAHDRTTEPLRRALAGAGWRVHGWNMGVNWGARADTVERLEGSGLTRLRPTDRCWSSAGAWADYSRGSWRRAVPQRVRAVVTLGFAVFGRSQDRTMSGGFMNGSPATRSTIRRCRALPTSRRCRTSPSGRGAMA